MENKTTAKDFFLHLGSMVALYATAISLVNLLFKVINRVYPEVTSYYDFSGSAISLQVAILIIVFPLLILLSWLLEKSYSVEPIKKQVSVKKWLTYITLFVGGIILVGDLVTVLYMFLDGQNLTTAFLLKALAVLVVAGGIFSFYIQDIRDGITPSGKKLWAILSLVIILGSIVLGFAIIGSPQTQRLMRYDDQKVMDLQNIQWQIVNYWQKKGALPGNLDAVNDPISGLIIPNDPETKLPYEYKKTNTMIFELCADFNLDAKVSDPRMSMPVEFGKTENWNHGVGKQCFSRTIDPELYPITKPLPIR